MKVAAVNKRPARPLTDFTIYQAFSVTTLAKTTCVQALVSKGLLFCRSPRWALSPCLPLPALGPSHLDRGFWGEHALLNALPGPLHFRSLYCSCCHIRIQNKTSVANTCVYVTVMIAWQETYHILNVLVKIPISMCWHSDV